jgi:hypothetical protein
MNDLTAFAIFAACLLATFGLVRLCAALAPRVPNLPDASSAASADQEPRA